MIMEAGVFLLCHLIVKGRSKVEKQDGGEDSLCTTVAASLLKIKPLEDLTSYHGSTGH